MKNKEKKSSKLGYLVGISLRRKVTTKWFMVVNIILALVIVGVINADNIIRFFGGDFDQKQVIQVVDNVNAYDLFKEQITTMDKTVNNKEESSYDIQKYTGSKEEAKKQLEDKEHQADMFLFFEKDATNTMKITILTKEYLDLVDTQLVTNAIQNTKVALAIASSGISETELTQIYAPASIERSYLDDSKNNADENTQMIMTTVFPVVILPFFMLTIFLVQMIGAEVNDEKTTRGMEIIISSVSPKVHFFSKCIAGNLFVIIQGILLFLFGGLGLLVRNLLGGSDITGGLGSEIGKILSQMMSSGLGEKLIYIIPLTLILMLITFVAYSLLAGILASMTTNIEDFQQVQTPMMIISLVGYYLAIMAGVFEGATFIKVLSFVPLISAILSPSLLVLGQIGIIEVIISIVIMIFFVFLLIRYGLRIYKVGILNYSSKGIWKKMYKALKN